MEYKPDVSCEGGTIPTQPPQGTVRLGDIDFSYPSKPNVEVLKSLSFEVPQNKVIALVGKSGCGKSSVIALLQRFYNPKSGDLFLDEKSV